MKTRKNIFLWVLYDFANSVVFIVFFLYFAQWIVIDRGISDFHFNLTFTISAVLLLLTAPFAGFLLDKFWRRITGLRVATLGTVLFYGVCAGAAVVGDETLALLFFTLGLYAYLLSFTFYTPLLNDIAIPQNRGMVSGLGIMGNFLGEIAGLLLALPFASGDVSLFGSSFRAETLFPSVTVFFLLSLPMLLLFREPKILASPLRVRQEVGPFLRETRNLLAYPSVSVFFLSYFLFNDAILTASNNFPIFLEQIWQVSDATKTYLLLGILITSAVGGLLAGAVADRFGHRRTLLSILCGWVILLPLVGLIPNFTFFVIAAVCMGFWFGATWTVSRSVMAYLAPSGRHNLAFSYFGLAERASSFVGPIVWGATVFYLTPIGAGRYRIAVLILTVFVVLGVFALRQVRDDRSTSLSF